VRDELKIENVKLKIKKNQMQNELNAELKINKVLRFSFSIFNSQFSIHKCSAFMPPGV